jgi:hypothetical protein
MPSHRVTRVLEGPWPARVTWAVLPLAVGPALAAALDVRSGAVARTGSAVAWAVWAAVLVAVLIPRTVSLTAVRIAAPAALGLANWAALAGPRGAADVAAVVGAAITVVAAFSPATGDCFVNGSSYGDERRMPLRVPGTLLLGPVPLAWLGSVAAPVAGPLLLAAGRWVPAVAVVAVGGPATVLGVRALHGLSRRWVVFVPAGMVLHDLHAMVDPVLFPRSTIARLGPAPVGGDGALDLTLRALGLALEVELHDPTDLAPRRADGQVEVQRADRILFSPTRPGAVLAEAARRRIAVGAP